MDIWNAQSKIVKNVADVNHGQMRHIAELKHITYSTKQWMLNAEKVLRIKAWYAEGDPTPDTQRVAKARCWICK